MWVSSQQLSECNLISHGFFGRIGGVSSGPFATLNVSLRNADRREDVLENRRRITAALDCPTDDITIARQVHGTRTVVVDQPWPVDEPAEADALVTSEPGVTLGVTTADCAPILLVDREAGVIGAAHAGWRGALDGIVDSVVMNMAKQGAIPARIQAAIGPCISLTSYEIGPEFEQAFLQADASNARFFSTNHNSARHFDLREYCASRLQHSGVHAIDILANDTYTEQDSFFSYRRACKSSEKNFGLQVAAITLRA